MYKISEITALKLMGKEYSKDVKFNPIQDIKGQWYISAEEYSKADITEIKEILKIIDVTKDVVLKSDYEKLKVDKALIEMQNEVK